MPLTPACQLWCEPGHVLEDCCVDTLAITSSFLFSLLIFAVLRCTKCTPPVKNNRQYKVLTWPRCILGLVVTLTHMLEAAEACLILAWTGGVSASTALALAVPIFSLVLLLSAAVALSRQKPPVAVRVMLLAAWVSGAVTRGTRLRHLTITRGLLITVHVRAATAASCTVLYCLLALTELLVIVLQQWFTRNTKVTKETSTSTAATEGYRYSSSSIISQAIFWWLTPLLWRGAKKPLELEDLGRLPTEESTQHLFQAFRRHYDREKAVTRGSISLWRCYARSCGTRLVLGGVYKLLGDLVGLAGPLGISIIIDYAASTNTSATDVVSVADITYPTLSEVLNNGYIMGCAVLIASLAQGTFSQASTHLVNVEGIRLKAALQALVYDKSLRLAVWSFGDNVGSEVNKDHESQTSGGDTVDHGIHGTDTGTIANLMSEDAYNVMSCVWIVHYVWAIPLKIGVIMWLLYLKLGWSAVLGAALCVIIMTPLQLLIGKRMSENSKLISEASDERLRKINETLQGIKLIKLYSWEDEFCKRILSVRAHELKLLDKDSLYWALMTFLTHASSALVTLVALVAYLLMEDSPLNPSDVFSALALFNQLTVPLFIFPVTVPLIIGAVISTKRFKDFLSLPEISDTHGPPPAPEPTIEKTEETHKTEATSANRVSGGLRDSNDSVFGPAGLGNIHEDEEEEEDDDTSYTPPAQNCHLQPVYNAIPVVTVLEDSGFAWRKDAESTALRVVSRLTLPQAQLTLIVGPVGSGKSSLLSALLGEMHSIRGSVTWDSSCSVAYVAQKPWLLNATLRDNILFGQAFRARRYARVVAACALQPDIAILPAGDLTHIGEKGIALSGGQRQRICVARALYSRASLLLLDDPLSALDAHVAQHVVESGVRRLLLRRQRRTVVLVTHRLQLLPLADFVIAMQDGDIRAQGTLTEIERRDPALVADWRAAMSRQAAAEEAQRGARGRTARERWQLVRLVSRFGAQIRQKPVAADGTWQPSEESHVPHSLFVPFRRRTFTSSLSRRHLSHDLPLPIDECGDEFVELAARSAPPIDSSTLRLSRAFSGRRNVFRTVSLQTGNPRRSRCKSGSFPQLKRQMSTPSMPQNSSTICPAPRPRTFTMDLPNNIGRQGSFLKRLFSSSSQRSAPPETQQENSYSVHPAGREKNVLRRLMSSSSSRSSVSAENERPTVRRLVSSTSAFSDDLNEDDELGEDDVSDEDAWTVANEEEREYGKVARRVYLSYLRASGILLGITYLVSALAWQTCRVVTDYWLSAWTEASSPPQPHHVAANITASTTSQQQLITEQMRNYLLVYAGLSGLSVILSLVSNALGQLAGAKARRSLHETALRAVLRSPMKFFEATPVGRIINRFASDMGVIDKKISISIQRLVQFLLLCVSAIGVNIVVSPWFTIIAIPTCLIYFWVQRFYRVSARELQRLDSLTRSPIFSHFSETLGGLSTIRAFGQQERFTRMLYSKMDAHRNAFLIMNSGNRWLGIALDYLGGVIVFTAVIAALASARFVPHLVTPALVGLAVNYTLLVPIYLNWVVKFLSDMEMYMTAVERVEQYARLPSEDYRDQDNLSVPEDWPQAGNIKFEGVSLRYDPDREPVISKLDLTIPAGQKVGICGRTGSGKSSLAMALFCMVEAHEGQLLVDGLDILHKVPLATLRSRLSAIPQDAIMFSGSLRENLDPKQTFSDEQLWSALELAQVRSTACALPGGLDGEVREGGENFSAGQRQLLCLARATLHGARCLVLDEATSSLDPATEQALIVAATRAFQGRTVITIAHRLATLLTCDRILVLSSGRIVEDASPAELLARPSSLFSEMLRASEEGSLL